MPGSGSAPLSPADDAVRRTARKVAPPKELYVPTRPVKRRTVRLLVLGETGVGKR